MKNWKNKLLAITSLLVSGSCFAAVDISTQIAAFQTDAETYVTAALPAVFTIIGLYFLVRVIKRFAR